MEKTAQSKDGCHEEIKCCFIGDGWAQVIVRAHRGAKGEIVVRATAEGLESAAAKVVVVDGKGAVR